jgi:hypothetical protein
MRGARKRGRGDQNSRHDANGNGLGEIGGDTYLSTAMWHRRHGRPPRIFGLAGFSRLGRSE